jgi:hypothetical protein
MSAEAHTNFSKFVSDHADHKIYLGMLAPVRPGVRLFFTAYKHYPQRAVRPREIEIEVLHWEGVLWGAMAVPNTISGRAEFLLPLCGLETRWGLPQPAGSPPFPSDRDLLLLDNTLKIIRACRLTASEVLQREQAVIGRIEAGERPPVASFQTLVWGLRPGIPERRLEEAV